MINSVTLVGHVGHDPRMTSLKNGGSMAQFSLACNETWGKGEDRQVRTHWFNCCAFGPVTGFLEQYVRRGAKVAVQGSLEYSEWEDRTSGQRRNKVEVRVRSIELLMPKNGS